MCLLPHCVLLLQPNQTAASTAACTSPLMLFNRLHHFWPCRFPAQQTSRWYACVRAIWVEDACHSTCPKRACCRHFLRRPTITSNPNPTSRLAFQGLFLAQFFLTTLVKGEVKAAKFHAATEAIWILHEIDRTSNCRSCLLN